MTYLLLIIISLAPVSFTVLFKLLDYKTKFKNLPEVWKQIIYIIVYGGLAIFGTECGVKINGVVANVRDAGPIIAGLFFGVPAGIGAGIIGALERMITGFYIPDRSSTLIACSVATLLAGILSSLFRISTKKDKKTPVVTACTTAIIIETFHMMLVYLTNINDMALVIKIYQSVVFPMIIANFVSVFLSGEAVKIIERKERNEKAFISFKRTNLSNAIQLSTSIIAVIVFAAGLVSITKIQSKVSGDNTTTILESTSNDIAYQTQNLAYYNEYAWCSDIAYEWSKNSNDDNETFTDFFTRYVGDACKEGYICSYSEGRYVFDESYPKKADGSLVTDFPQLIKLIEKINDPSYTAMYACSNTFVESCTEGNEPVIYLVFKPTYSKLENKYVFVSMNRKQIYNGVAPFVSFILSHQTYSTGQTIIFGDKIDSDTNYHYIGSSFTKEEEIALAKQLDISSFNSLNKIIFNNIDYYAVCVKSDSLNGFYAYALVTQEEAELSAKVSLYFNTFLFVIVLGFVFILANNFIDRLIVRKMAKVGDALDTITRGNLDTKVDVYGFEEFNKLSDGINHTVDRLKGYIEEEKNRINQELEYARDIQLSSLPGHEFNADGVYIYAATQPAKFVGGDFYDFYQSKDNKIHFLIADVSGKGIPAALFMMRGKAVLRSATFTFPYPNNVYEANNTLGKNNPNNMFVTLFQACFNPKNGELIFVNGGHEDPFIAKKGKPFIRLNTKRATPLGCVDNAPYALEKIKLNKGDKVFIYTDGCEDARNKANVGLGNDNLLKIVNKYAHLKPSEIAQNVNKEINNYQKGREQFDDITMLVFEYKGIIK